MPNLCLTPPQTYMKPRNTQNFIVVFFTHPVYNNAKHIKNTKTLLFQSTLQLDSNTAALELLTCDLTNKDEAISINRATMAVNKPGKTFNKEPV